MDSEIRYQIGTTFLMVDPEQAPSPDLGTDDHINHDQLPERHEAMDVEEADPSWVIQASALALSTTFVLVTPPVGLAMFTYAALRQGTAMDLIPRSLDFANSDLGWFKNDGFQQHEAIPAE